MGRACYRDGRVGLWWENVIATDHLKYVRRSGCKIDIKMYV